MTTMAAIDRVIHHCVILDMVQVESYRAQQAKLQHLSEAGTENGNSNQPESTKMVDR